MEDDVNYIIEEINRNYDFIIIKPYSKHFKKTIHEYPSYRIDVNAITYVDDPRIYLAEFCKPLINEILEREKNYIPENFLNAFDGMENQTITVSNSELTNNKIIDVIDETSAGSSNLNFIIS
jgi:hypothetical protein